MSDVKLAGVRKSFGILEVIKGVDLDIKSGDFIVFVGPTGSGKSTLLRMISGLATTSAGRIFIDRRDVTRLPPGERSVAMVFQSYALYPHMTAEENMSFGLRMTGTPKTEIKRRVAEAARILRIEPLLKRKPKQLSGGQRQRVAIGRAIVRQPKVFLFDEPLSSLDAALRVEMRIEIARIHAELGATMIYVTHDQVEAMTLADEIVLINEGVVEQVGAPLELYERPKNCFVAGFLGQPKMNFLAGTVTATGGENVSVMLGPKSCTLSVRVASPVQIGEKLTLGIRPDAMDIVKPGDGHLVGRVEVVEHLGAECLVYVTVDETPTFMVARILGKTKLSHAEPISLRINTAFCHVFNANGVAIP